MKKKMKKEEQKQSAPTPMSMPSDDRKWKVENAARTIEDHAMIMADPELHDEAMKIVDKKHKAIKSIKDLKAKSAEMDAQDSMGNE